MMKTGDKVYVEATVVGTGDSEKWATVYVQDVMLESHQFAVHVGRIVEPRSSNAEFRVGADHPDTSKAVEPKMRRSTFQYEVLEMFDDDDAQGIFSLGFTDDELEMKTGRTHQSVSAARNTLFRKGLIHPTGERRSTRSGNDAIVWRRTTVKAEVKG